MGSVWVLKLIKLGFSLGRVERLKPFLGQMMARLNVGTGAS